MAFATTVAVAEEDGAGHYIPGALSTLIDPLPSKPGWAVEAAYLHYDGDAGVSRTLPLAGLITADLEATSDAFLVGSFYTFQQPVLSAWYSVGAFAPLVRMDVEATVTTLLGPVRRHDTETGFGDVTLLPLMMGWKCSEWQVNAVLSIYAPTGEYEAGRLGNPGLNRWTFDPTVGLSYNGAKNGFNAELHTGVAINTKNDDTDYRSGSVWHVEASAQQLLPLGPGFLGIGASLGAFEGRTVGVIPVLTYLMPIQKNTFVVEARWLPELDTRNRPEGDFFWLKAVLQFWRQRDAAMLGRTSTPLQTGYRSV